MVLPQMVARALVGLTQIMTPKFMTKNHEVFFFRILTPTTATRLKPNPSLSPSVVYSSRLFSASMSVVRIRSASALNCWSPKYERRRPMTTAAVKRAYRR